MMVRNDTGSSGSTWDGIFTPAYNLIGGDETDTNALGTFFFEGWRLTPFLRYPSSDDKFQVILPGQDHLGMGELASPAVQEYLAENTRLFFDVYVRRQTSRACGIGTSPAFEGQFLSVKSEEAGGLAFACPPPIGVPEPSFPLGMTCALLTASALMRIRSAPAGLPKEDPVCWSRRDGVVAATEPIPPGHRIRRSI